VPLDTSKLQVTLVKLAQLKLLPVTLLLKSLLVLLDTSNLEVELQLNVIDVLKELINVNQPPKLLLVLMDTI
jgi:hypothetical protein